MSIIGAHKVSSPARAYTVHRNSGLITIAITWAFATAILATQGEVIATPGWRPLLDWTNGYAIVGGTLMLSAFLGVTGLAFENEHHTHEWPRLITLASAIIGMLWFVTSAVAFTFAWIAGYPNAGPFLAMPGAVLHGNRLLLLSRLRRAG